MLKVFVLTAKHEAKWDAFAKANDARARTVAEQALAAAR